MRVSGTLRPVLAPASPQALPIPQHPPILSHPLAALRTSGGERRAGCQRSPTPSPAGLRQRGPGRFPEEPGEKFEAKSGGGWTAGELEVRAASGSQRTHTLPTPNPDTSTGTDHVRGHTTVSPPAATTKRESTKRGHRSKTATQSHRHTKARADASPRTQIHKDSQP